MQTPHDIFFHFSFAQPQHAAAFVRSYLRGPLAAVLDWTSLVAQDATFVDAELQEQFADLLFTARTTTGRQLLVYLLLEHKSDDKRFTALQLLDYSVRIWQQYRREHGREALLPQILPLVPYHGAKAFRSPRQMRRLIDLRGLPTAAARWLRRRQPDATFVLVDLTQFDEGELRQRTPEAGPLLSLLFLRGMRGAKAKAALRNVARWIDVVGAVLTAPFGAEALQAYWTYALRTSSLRMHGLRRLLKATLGTKAEQTVMTTADRIEKRAARMGEARGMEKGMEKGLEQGMVQGEILGTAKTLLRLLRKKFGDLPATVVERIHRAPPADLDCWTEALLDAKTLAEVFAAPPAR